MNIKILRGTLICVLFLATVAAITSCSIIDSQIDHHMGANTKLIDTNLISFSTSPLAIINVKVISADSSQFSDNLTVLIDQGIITHVSSKIDIGDEYTVIDATDMFLIPGLVDSHTHLHRSKNDLFLYLANGVTRIANMSSLSDNTYIKWRDEAETGSLSPSIYIAAGGMSSKAGLMVNLKTYFGASPGFNNAEQTRKAARKFRTQGYDAIKAYNMNRESYLALTDEAQKLGIPIVGHLSAELTFEDLYSSGQAQVAHIEELTKATMRAFGTFNQNNGEEYLDYVRSRADVIAAKLKQNNIAVSSTLWLMESLSQQRFNTANFLKTIPLEYQNPGIIEGSWLASGWLPGDNRYQSTIDPSDFERLEEFKSFTDVYITAIHIMLKALINNSVTILAGSDSNAAGVIAGFSLLDELESLSNAGMTNTQVLQSATRAPAVWMQINGGVVAEGYIADLVLLRANPIKDVKNLRAIEAVITNGKHLSKPALDRILKLIKHANNESRKTNIDEYLMD